MCTDDLCCGQVLQSSLLFPLRMQTVRLFFFFLVLWIESRALCTLGREVLYLGIKLPVLKDFKACPLIPPTIWKSDVKSTKHQK